MKLLLKTIIISGLFINIFSSGFTTYSSELMMKYDADGNVNIVNKPVKRRYYSIKKNNIYDEIISVVAYEQNIDPFLVKCIIRFESSFNPRAVSSAGAMGLMQLMPVVVKAYNVKDPFDPEQNIRAGVRHFSSMMKQLNYDIPLSLAAYHAGLSRVKKRMDIPQIPATKKYVEAVMNAYDPDGIIDYTK